MAKSHKVIWTAGARNDLDEIIGYIANDSTTAALALLEEVLNAGESLMTLSERGRVVPELQDPDVRELFIKRYRLFYEVRPSSACAGSPPWCKGVQEAKVTPDRSMRPPL